MPHGNPKRGEQKVSKQVILTTYEGGNVGGPKFMFQWRFQKKKKKKKKRKEKTSVRAQVSSFSPVESVSTFMGSLSNSQEGCAA